MLHDLTLLCTDSLVRLTGGGCRQHRQFLKVKALSSGSFRLSLSGFLFAESFISGVREAQGSFSHWL